MWTTYVEAGVGPSVATPTFTGGDLVRHRLLSLWDGREDDPLDRMSTYALLPPGKMLRPLLALESARSVGGFSDDLVELVLAIEYLHVATLVHDDIIDEDDVRRGRPSVPAAFGIPPAIVGGDGLILEAFAALTKARSAGVSAEDVVAAMAAMAEAGLSLCRGQLREAELTGNLECGVDGYLTVAGLKTGALFEAACRIGAILGGGRPKWIEALGTFGQNLGIAFQIRDDLLEFGPTSTQIGKPRHSDLNNHRPTLPVLLAHQRATDSDRAILRQIFEGRRPDEQSHAQVRAILIRAGAHDAAGEYASDVVRLAKNCLVDLPAGESTALGAIADYALARSF